MIYVTIASIEKEQAYVMNLSGIKRVRQSRLGVYVWRRSNGKILANENGDMLAIDSYYGDQYRAEVLKKTAHKVLWREGLSLEGKVDFLDNQHTCTDEEFYEQLWEFHEKGELN